MIFRLEYKNKALKTARVDIITPTGTGVETVEGTGYPFRLKYEGDKKNKGLMFLSSSAEINIYETPLFNIDTLKTSGEKDIRVNYYIDSALEWTGFVIPDFFSREIGGDGVVSMVASDRLSVLDSEVLEGLPVTVTLRTLLSSCLAKTGLTLPLKTVVDFATVSGSTNHVLNHSIRSQRLTDTKGRSVNCKDIIKSILVATNSKLMQRKGAWWVVNKMQHELGGGRVYTSPTAFTNYVEDLISFTDVTRGAMRTIAPVAGGVGVFQEYGGGALAPNNYAFESGLSGWTLHNGFTASTNNRRVLGYTKSGNVATPIYDSPGTARPYLLNRNLRPRSVTNIGLNNVYTIPHARTSIPVISADPFSAKIKFEVNATGRGGGDGACLIVILKRPGRDNLVLNRDGQWEGHIGYKGLLFASFTGEELEAVDGNGSISGTIDAAGDEGFEDDINDYSIDLLILGSGTTLSDGTVVRDETVLINSASVQFSAASNDTPKGTLYKADQGGEAYTKIHDTETTVFGDYLTGGLNGYFYNYAPDDTSSLLAPNGSRSQPAWVNTFTQNTEPLPLLQQTIRQMRRMFSVAHDFIKGEIDVADFDPLSIFEDCERRFVIVEAEFDFLRGSLQVVLEEVAYKNLTVREFIYSYFGEGDEGIRGISGISAGSSGGGGGGGMAPEPSWLENEITIDPDSGLLSVGGWHVKGNLIIEGQVNQWLAQQLVVDDARIQVNRRQGGATVDSGLVIYNKDTSTEVSSLVYDVDGIWRAGGDRLFTDAYNPTLGGVPAADYALKSWVENSATAYNAARLGGYVAADYPRKAENAVVTGAWEFTNNLTAKTYKNVGNAPRKIIQWERADGTLRVAMESTGFNDINFSVNEVTRITLSPNTGNITAQGNLSAVNAALSGTLDVSGTSTLTGAVTAGGNVGTSNFASQLRGWRVTPAGVADFRHIYTDELQAKAFTADISQALVGSDVLTKSVAKLAQNWATTANGATSTIYVEELEGFPGFQVFAVGDKLLLRLFDRSGGGLLIKNIWATVASYVSTTKNVQRYTITVNSGGATGHTVYAGSMILDYGTSGSGVIERTVLDAMGSPYSQVKTWVNDPSNPANYTIHNRTGNLDGIANASGFGFYGENTFLTKKLLVGDLTKAGQYMEYENGQLSIKGQITVTGGNAATKEDVDAVQVGGRNLIIRKTEVADTWIDASGNIATQANHATSDFIPVTAVSYMFSREASVLVSEPYFRWAWYDSDKIYIARTASSTISFSWTPPSGAAFVRISYPTDCYPKFERGNRATDWTPAPEDVDAGIAAAQTAADNANASVTSLNTYVDGAFKDGVIDTAEAKAIEKYKNSLSETKLSVDGSYTQLYNNAYLTGTPKSNLSTAKTALNTAYTNLVNSINTAIADGKTTAAEKSDVDSKFALFNTALATYRVRVEEANAAIQVAVEGAAKDYTDDLTTRVENTLGLADLEGINQTLITGGKVRTALLQATEIAALVVTAERVEGLTLNFDKGTIGGWSMGADSISSENAFVRLHKENGIAVSNTATTDNVFANNNRVNMYYFSEADWGLSGRVGGDIIFQLGSTNRIAGINFDDSKLSTENWELNKDGSFYFGAGGEIEGGLITGVIESQNWNGTKGSKFNLADGSLEFGNVIRLDAFSKEILVRDTDTQQNGVRMGNFLLSPTTGGAGALDVDVSGSRTVNPGVGYDLRSDFTYINGSGVIGSSSVTVSTSLSPGNSYAFQTDINARINRRSVVDTKTDPIGAPSSVINSLLAGNVKPLITVSLFSGATKVGEQRFDPRATQPGEGTGTTYADQTLSVNIPFVADSNSLRVEITQSGEVIWKVRYPANAGALVELRKVDLVYSELNAASRVRIIPSSSVTEISAKGFQSLWGESKYFRIYDRVGVTNFIEARGVQQFISPNGTYRLRVSDTGIQKSTNGGSTWTTL